MSKDTKGISRRKFIGAAAGSAAAGVLSGAGLASERAEENTTTSRVVLIRDPEVFDAEGGLRSAVLHDMLNEAVTTLLQADTSAAAWKELVSPDDIVGIKSNVWRRLPTPSALEEAIRSEVVTAGVAAENVAVADRGIHSNPFFLGATSLINVRPMRTHHWSGLGTCLKNLIPFVPRPSDYHGDTCATLGALWHLPAIEGKVRLNILVMLTPQFHGVGPHSFSERFVWPYGGLIVGTEPASVDATGARIIQAKRSAFFGEERPISPPAHHIEIAGARYGLGATDPAAIDLVRLGKGEDWLI